MYSPNSEPAQTVWHVETAIPVVEAAVVYGPCTWRRSVLKLGDFFVELEESFDLLFDVGL